MSALPQSGDEDKGRLLFRKCITDLCRLQEGIEQKRKHPEMSEEELLARATLRGNSRAEKIIAAVDRSTKITS